MRCTNINRTTIQPIFIFKVMVNVEKIYKIFLVDLRLSKKINFVKNI